MALWRLSWREFCRRPLRTLLTLFSIVIGVAAVLAVSLAINNARLAQQSMLKAVAGQTDIEVASTGNAAFSESIVAELRKVPGVKLATGIIRRNSAMFPPGKDRVSTQYLGVDPKLDQEVREYRIVAGEPLTDYDQILVDKEFADQLELKIGDKVGFTTSSLLREGLIVGLIEPKTGSAVTQGGLVILPLPTAQSWSRARGKLDIAQIVLDEKTDRTKLLADIQAILPDGLRARVPPLRSDIGQEATVAMDHGLGMASAFSFMIGIFIIYNTFQMNVGERRRQLGILRALGATRKQIVRMIVGEGIALGVLGTLLGWGLGLIATRWLTNATAQMLDISISSYTFNSPMPFALSAVCGLAVAGIGAYFPARRAARLSPAEAMRVIAAGDLEPNHLLLLLLGCILSPIGFVVLVLCVLGRIHIDHAIAGCVLFLLGYIFMIPSFLSRASQFVLNVCRRWFHVEGTLAQKQLLRHRIRTSLTIGILFIAISTGLGMASTILDNIQNVRSWADSALVGDFFIRATMAGLSSEHAADLPADLVTRIEEIPGIKQVDATRHAQTQLNGLTVIAIARNFQNRERKTFQITSGDHNAIFNGLLEGQVVIGSVLAERGKIKVGDSVKLDTQKGPVDVKVAGIANDYINAGLTVYMNRPRAEELLNIEGANIAIIDAEPGKLEEVSKALKELCSKQGLLLHSQSELIQVVRNKVDGTVAGLWAVLGLCSLIAAFGLVNTLTMNILEQTGEIGMLRAVAMTRGQVRKMVFSQAVFMGVIGLLPGVLAGLMIAYLLALSVLPTTGHAIEFQFRPWLVLGVLLAELLVVLIASLIPAERAARIPVAQAMQYQ
jgi:putative ABC transport system permease protein